jgi:hypothetical protein
VLPNGLVCAGPELPILEDPRFRRAAQRRSPAAASSRHVI